jgi:hypothetical protein
MVNNKTICVIISNQQKTINHYIINHLITYTVIEKNILI